MFWMMERDFMKFTYLSTDLVAALAGLDVDDFTHVVAGYRVRQLLYGTTIHTSWCERRCIVSLCRI